MSEEQLFLATSPTFGMRAPKESARVYAGLTLVKVDMILLVPLDWPDFGSYIYLILGDEKQSPLI